MKVFKTCVLLQGIMRCHHASLLALITNPNFTQPWIIEEAIRYAKASTTSKWVKNELFLYLPLAESQKLLDAYLTGIRKTQHGDGLWGQKQKPMQTYYVLKILDKHKLLNYTLTLEQFKVNPWNHFTQSADIYTYLVRNHYMKRENAQDRRFLQEYLKTLFSHQHEDGSWNHSLITTCKALNDLRELGFTRSDERVQNAIKWVKTQYSEDAYGNTWGIPYGPVGSSMFQGHTREEFQAAIREFPEWDPKQACYNHLGILQNGYTLFTLNRLGCETDPLVVKALENLVDLKIKYGGWCKHHIRDAYLATHPDQKKEINRLQRMNSKT